MTVQVIATPKVRSGTLAAYVTGAEVTRVQQVRARVGAVTVSGNSGLKVLRELAAIGQLDGVDLDPAQYLAKPKEQQELFAVDWEAQQLDLGLSVVRSRGVAVRRNDDQLRLAMTEPVRSGTRRLVSLHSSWLHGGSLSKLLKAVRSCDDPLSLVFADLFDPFAAPGAIDGWQLLLDAAAAPDRPVELLRADMQAIPFVLAGGSLGAIGLTSQGRHHPLPFPTHMRKAYEERQRSPWVWVEHLLGWERGIHLGALEPFGETGLTDCPCDPCDGEPLTQYAREWPTQVPTAVRERAQDHDADRWISVFRRLRARDEPLAGWAEMCKKAIEVEGRLVTDYKIAALKVPASIAQWAK
jgi:hypothetical protein